MGIFKIRPTSLYGSITSTNPSHPRSLWNPIYSQKLTNHNGLNSWMSLNIVKNHSTNNTNANDRVLIRRACSTFRIFRNLHSFYPKKPLTCAHAETSQHFCDDIREYTKKQYIFHTFNDNNLSLPFSRQFVLLVWHI